MKILALELSTSRRSAAVVELFASGARAISCSVETKLHSGSCISLIENSLRAAGCEQEQIQCLAVGIGPGSYTGIRSAISVAQGWQLAREVSIVGIGSVDALIEQARMEKLAGRLGVVIDAQRGEFYFSEFALSPAGRKELAPLRLVSRSEVLAREEDGTQLVGPDICDFFPDAQPIFPQASTLGLLAAERANYVRAEELQPIYLRETTFVKAPPPRIV
jgi:tRNA threonylcarbamoyl adenosine modification protein YeaZ